MSARRILFRQPLTWILLLYSCRVILILGIVPLWQNPDEPQHVAEVLATAERLDGESGSAIEQNVIHSMAEHEWWRYYGRERPHPLPSAFESVDSVGGRQRGAGRAYYWGMAVLVSWFGPSHVDADVYFLRSLAAAAGVLTLCCCWIATRMALGQMSALVVGAALALHPQFLIVTTTAGPDAFINLCGAFLWWQAVRLQQEPQSVAALSGVWLAAAGGAFTRRLGLLLIPMALLATGMAVTAVIRRSRRERWVIATAVSAIVLAATGIWFWARSSTVDVVVPAVELILTAPYADQLTWEFLGRFTRNLLDSAWLVAGWLRYPAPRAWLDLMHILTALALAGLVGVLWRRGPERRTIGLAALLVLVPTVAIYGYYFPLMVGPAGRYFFPAIGPLAVCFWSGLRQWWPETWWTSLAVAVVTLMAVFDLMGWMTVLIPAYG